MIRKALEMPARRLETFRLIQIIYKNFTIPDSHLKQAYTVSASSSNISNFVNLHGQESIKRIY